MHLAVSFADENVNVVEAVHQTVSPPAYSRKNTGLPSRSLLELRVDVRNGPPTLRSGVAAPKAFGAGGEGNRTPVLVAIHANIYMFIR